LAQGSPSGRLAGKKSSSLRSGIFFRQALPPKHRQSENRRPVKSGKTIPMGFIHH